MRRGGIVVSQWGKDFRVRRSASPVRDLRDKGNHLPNFGNGKFQERDLFS